MTDKQFIHAQELLDASYRLGVQILDSGFRPSFIVGVWRGGTPVGIAVQELLEEEFRPKRGRLILIPTMNPPAYRARQRARPGGLDLNRCFPGDAEAEEPERRLARQSSSSVSNRSSTPENALLGR